jgi:flavorubredoxin
MKARKILDGITWVGSIDWDRRLFDSLIPIPHGTSYNAYLLEGRDKTALLDTVDSSCIATLLGHLEGVPRLDYIVSHHAEQDHSGAIPFVLAKYPEAVVLATPKGKDMLIDHLHLAADRIQTVADGDTLDLGGKTLRFIHAPWQHWPETMMSYCPEGKILFSCDLFGSHLACAELFTAPARLNSAAKAYYAEIMMPFAKQIERNIEKIARLEIDVIAPSHGPMHLRSAGIVELYKEWVGAPPKNLAVVPHVTMHGSTREMVEHFLVALGENGVRHEAYELTTADLGLIANSLVDAATLVIATPTVLGGAHPHAVTAAYLANALRPRIRYAAVIGSYGWGGNSVNQLGELLAGLKPEWLPPVMTKGHPKEADFLAVEELARTIAAKHREAGLV